MEFVALGWLVLELTGSPIWVGVSSAARMAPFFVLGLVSGAVADRVDRRIFIRWVTIAGVVIAALTAAVLYLGYEQNTGSNDTPTIDIRIAAYTLSAQVIWLVIVLTMMMGCVWAFTMTLRQAYTYDIVGPASALNGISLSGLSQRIGGVVGAPIAGVIIAMWSVDVQYLVIALFYALSTIILIWTREAGQSAQRTPQSVLQNLVACVHIIASNRVLAILMLLAAITEIFGFTHMSMTPVLARDELGVGPFGLSIMSMFQQVGGLIGLLILAALGNFRRKGILIFLTAAGFGIGEMSFAVGGGFGSFVLALAFINACASIVDALYKTMMQENVENEQRGRAMGAWVLSIGVAPVGHVGIGALAGAFGAVGALLINGSILFTVSIATGLGLRQIRQLP